MSLQPKDRYAKVSWEVKETSIVGCSQGCDVGKKVTYGAKFNYYREG